MKLQGLSSKAIYRIAKVLKSQDEGPDYGESEYLEEVIEAFEEADAKWTDQGWIVEGDLRLEKLGLTRLPLIKEIRGDLACFHNRLTSLKGSPEYVGGDFLCGANQLTSLEGGPLNVVEDFDCNNNQLTTLEGAPQFVGGNFHCEHNELISLEGLPEEIEKEVFYSFNPIWVEERNKDLA